MSIPYKGRKKVTKPFVTKDGVVFEHYTEDEVNNFVPEEFNIVKDNYLAGNKADDVVKPTIQSEGSKYLDDVIKVASEPLKIALDVGKNLANTGIAAVNIGDKYSSEALSAVGIDIAHEDIPSIEVDKSLAPVHPGSKLLSDIAPYSIGSKAKAVSKGYDALNDILKSSPKIQKALGITKPVVKEAASTTVGSATYSTAHDKDFISELATDTAIGLGIRGVASPFIHHLNKTSKVAENVEKAYETSKLHKENVEHLLEKNKILENFENSIVKELPKDAKIKPANKALIEMLSGAKDFNTVGELGNSIKKEAVSNTRDIKNLMKDAPISPDELYSASKTMREASVLTPSVSVSGLPEYAQALVGASAIGKGVSKLGTLGEKTLPLGVASKVRSYGQDKALDKLLAPAKEDLSFVRNSAEEQLRLAHNADNLDEIKSLEHQLEDINVVEKSIESGRELTEKELDSLYKSHIQTKRHSTDAPTPLETYYTSKDAREAIKGSEVAAFDKAGISTILAGYITGGLSTVAQAGLYGAKRGVDNYYTKRFEKAVDAVKAEPRNNAIFKEAELLAKDGKTKEAQEVLSTLDTTSLRILDGSLAAPVETLRDTSTFVARTGENLVEELTEADKGIIEWDSDYEEVSGSELGKIEWEAVDTGDVDNISWDTDTTEVEDTPKSVVEKPVVVGKMFNHSPEVNRIYYALTQSETGSMPDQYMRTMAKDSKATLHSSAYGPAQLTYSTAQGYLNQYPNLFTSEEKEYLRKFVDQGKKFIRHSKGEFQGDSKVWGYGGTGVLTSDNDRRLYESVTKKMLGQVIKRKGTLGNVLTSWRGDKMDRAYNKRFKKAYLSYK